ncbi:TRAM domain-containing protein [Candidatus Saccharibacteria bacterium]|nr:TRAM domain-containing protein [Candidatus Saccharibacteria bacterium]NCU40492.1 TRAM domain-containing protein [Candidatus Saccharibacteria bacterium]
MELITIILVAIFAETSYLAFRTLQPAKISEDSLLIDTSVLIDGRILSIARSNLLGSKLVVPTSVVRELQFMADKADHDKRERARFGLDIINQLQALETVNVEVIDDGLIDQNGVDEQLLKLAQKWRAKLCTIDYNLNKSARVQGVIVVNINELAHALRTTHLPGEIIEIKLQQQGQDSHQAVGYLDDGTMVVVDHAKQRIGQNVQVEATRVLQTEAGKMLFARLVNDIPNIKSRETKKPILSAKKPNFDRNNRQTDHRVARSDRSVSPKTQTGRKHNRKPSQEDRLVDLANN